MGGKDQARAQRNKTIAAQAAEFHLLQYAQKFDLCKGAQVSDFIQEERAVCGLLKVTFAGTDRAGECALLMTEQLGLNQGFRNSAAGDGNKRTAGAGTKIMDGAGNQFLAGSAVARHQDRGVEIGYATYQLINPLHVRARSNQPIASRRLFETLLHGL